MKKYNYLILISLFIAFFSQAMNTKRKPSVSIAPSAKRVKITPENDNKTLTFISSDGKQIILPKKIAYLSGTIKKMIDTCSGTEKPIPLSIDYQTLSAIHILLQLQQGLINVQKFINNQDDKIQNSHEIREKIQQCLAQKKLMSSLPMTMHDMAKLFNAATFLDTPVIFNALIHSYINPYLPEYDKQIIDFQGTFKDPDSPDYVQYCNAKNIHKLITIGIPRDAINHFAKIFFIVRGCNILEPAIWLNATHLSVNDYLQNDKTFNPVKKTFMTFPIDIHLKKLKLTHLYGLENLPVKNNVVDTIDLSHNWLSSLDDRVFKNYTNMRLLNLYCNRLTTLNSQAFIGLDNLQTLGLSNNCFTTLTDPKTFEHLSNLNKLVLSHCLIKQFDPKILTPLKKLEILDIRGNPWIRAQLSKQTEKETKQDRRNAIHAHIKKCCPSLQRIIFYPRPTPNLPRTRHYRNLPMDHVHIY